MRYSQGEHIFKNLITHIMNNIGVKSILQSNVSESQVQTKITNVSYYSTHYFYINPIVMITHYDYY